MVLPSGITFCYYQNENEVWLMPKRSILVALADIALYTSATVHLHKNLAYNYFQRKRRTKRFTKTILFILHFLVFLVRLSIFYLKFYALQKNPITVF